MSLAMAASCTFTPLYPSSVDRPDDLLCKLMYTSMELQKVRAEGRLQETELWRLQELLSMMTKERDEAREECRRLQECFLLQQTPAMGVDSASSFMHSSSMVSSPSSISPWSLQELEEHLNSDDFCPSVGAPTPFELQQALESLVQSCDKGQPFSQMKPGYESSMQISHPDIQSEALDQTLGFDVSPCVNLPEPQQLTNKRVSIGSPSVRSLSRQSSSNSSSASVQSIQRGQVPMESLDGMAAELAPAVTMASIMPCPLNIMPCAPSATGCHALHAAIPQSLPLTPLIGSSGATSAIDNPPVKLTGRGAPIAHDVTMRDSVSCVANDALPSSSIECNNGASAASDHGFPQKLCMGNDILPTNASAAYSMPGNDESVVILSNTSGQAWSATGSNTPSLARNGVIARACMGKSLEYPPSPMAKDAPFSATTSTVISHSLAASAPSTKLLSTGPVLTSNCTAVSSTYHHQQATTPSGMRQFHLPEPPEADPQVMLNSLPEKGKLLQAVMQAGPLLQTLLLAGPLPQWRYPPPALSNRDIPRVSLAPGHVLLTSAGMQGVAGGTSGSPSTITRKRIAIAEPGLQNKKLRKLSPSPVKKSHATCMASGGSERRDFAVGSFSQQQQHSERHLC